MKTLLVLVSVVSSTLALPALAADAQTTATTVCAACHGPDGNSFNGDWPKLAGQHPQYTIAQLAAFRCAARGNFIYDEIPEHLMIAYDQIAETLDRPARIMIENYFRQVVNYLRTFPRYLGNYDPYIARWEAIAGRVIGEPEFTHGAIIRLGMILRYQLYADGMWNEGSPFYGVQVYRSIAEALPYLSGYSDPSDFTGREDGQHYENFDPIAELPKMTLFNEALQKLLTPDGELAIVYDTGCLRRPRWSCCPCPASLSSQSRDH